MMFNKILHKRGQSALEYAVLLAIIVGAIVVMQVYIKRGIQGRFRESTDDIGEQYDPAHQTYSSTTKSVSTIRETTRSDGETRQATELKTAPFAPQSYGQSDKEQKTLRWANTNTETLNTVNTEWGSPKK